tara:strand:+ start:19 stop:1011 length:993 start_codon:yes stop_codon:yes gene_type:complete
MDRSSNDKLHEAYQEVYLQEKGMSSDSMSSVLKGHKYSKKQLFDMSKKSTKEGRHGEAHALYKEFQKSSYEPDGDMVEGYDKPDEKLKTDRDGMRISKKDADAARERIKAKTMQKRLNYGKKTGYDRKEWDESVEHVGRHRREYESYKTSLKEHHAEKFTEWYANLETEGYDVSRWDLDDLVETYVSENNLWKSVDIITEAVETLSELTRYAKEKGKDPQTGNESKKGGTMKGSAMAAVRKDLVKTGGLRSSRGKAIQPQGKKKTKGAKNPNETSDTKRKIAKMQAAKKAEANTASDAKKRGFKSVQNYKDTMARYGGKDNYDKGRGLGS